MAHAPDERQPLLHDDSTARQYDDATKDVIDFHPNGDADDPLQWPVAYKWSVVALLAVMAFTVLVKINFLQNTGR